MVKIPSINEAPLVPYRYIEESGVVESGPSVLHHIVVTGDGSNHTYLDVHDGVSTRDPKVMRLRTQSNVSRTHSFSHVIFFPRGIYANFETNLESAMISSESLQGYLCRILGWEKTKQLT